MEKKLLGKYWFANFLEIYIFWNHMMILSFRVTIGDAIRIFSSRRTAQSNNGEGCWEINGQFVSQNINAREKRQKNE